MSMVFLVGMTNTAAERIFLHLCSARDFDTNFLAVLRLENLGHVQQKSSLNIGYCANTHLLFRSTDKVCGTIDATRRVPLAGAFRPSVGSFCLQTHK